MKPTVFERSREVLYNQSFNVLDSARTPYFVMFLLLGVIGFLEEMLHCVLHDRADSMRQEICHSEGGTAEESVCIELQSLKVTKF